MLKKFEFKECDVKLRQLVRICWSVNDENVFFSDEP